MDAIHSILLILLLIFFITNSYLRETKEYRLPLDWTSLILSIFFMFYFFLEFYMSPQKFFFKH
jgi:uncharacterized membrane protein